MISIRENLSGALASASYNDSLRHQQTLTRQISNGNIITGPQSDKVALGMNQRMTAQYVELAHRISGANQFSDQLQKLDTSAASVSESLQRLRELALQAATDTVTDTDRALLQSSYEQQVAEITSEIKQQNISYRDILGADQQLRFQLDTNGEKLNVGTLASTLMMSPDSVPPPLQADVRVSAIATQTLAGTTGSAGNGQPEIQKFALTDATLANATRISLTHGGSTITAVLSNGIGNTIADAASRLQAQISALGGTASFDVSADPGVGLQLQWRADGNQAGLASLRLEQANEVPDYQANAIYNFGGWSATEVVQDWYGIDPRGLSGYQAELVFGTTVLHAGPFTGSETSVDVNGYQGYEIFQEMATAFNNDPARASIGSPLLAYDPVGQAAVLTMRWASVQASFPTAYIHFYKDMTATETQAGASGSGAQGTAEVQDIALRLSDFIGKSVELITDTATLSATWNAGGSLNDLVTALQGDTDYASAGFTLSAHNEQLRLTYTATGPVATLAELATVPEPTPTPELPQRTTIDKTGISTRADAEIALDALDEAIELIGQTRSGYGSAMNRLSLMVDSMTSQSLNVQISRTKLIETDYAVASASLIRERIKADFATYVMSQANISQSNVMHLLRP